MIEDKRIETARIIASLRTSLKALFPNENEPLAVRLGKPVHVVKSLEEIRGELGDCRRCQLYKSRKNIVFGEGNPKARLMFVGEGPGGDEDRQGKPFVGRAGQLLTRMIQAIKLERKEVYIANIIKCRPPDNRNPLPLEIESCSPFLLMQIRSIRPAIICALGKFAAQTILDTDAPITALRGRFHKFDNILVMPTFHPAYLLRNPDAKRQAWEDLQAIQAEYLKSG